MKRATSILLTALAVGFAFPIAAQQQTPASVTGIVADESTGTPLAKAIVELRRSGPNEAPYTLTTSADGVFSFGDLSVGQYQLSANRGGYIRGDYSEQNTGNAAGLVTLKAGEELKNVRLFLAPAGTISGRIVDAMGEPVTGADVQALRVNYTDGRTVLSSVKNARTNDLGEYRIFWLAPGRYFVAVNLGGNDSAGTGLIVINPEGPTNEPGPNVMAPISRSVTARPVGAALREGEARVPVYYPGTPDPSAATSIEVRAGMETAGIDVQARPAATRRVRGSVVNAATGQPSAAQIRLVPLTQVNLLNTTAVTYNGTADAVTGAFNMQAVPGSYLLIATVNAGPQFGGPRGAPGGAGPRGAGPGGGPRGDSGGGGLTARIPVEILDRDVESVALSLSTGITLSGRVTGASAQGLTVELRTQPAVQGVNPISSPVAADGTFTLRNVPDGDYNVYVRPLLNPPAPAMNAALPAALAQTYVKSARIGAENLMAGGLRVSGQTDETLEIALSSGAGIVEGRIASEGHLRNGLLVVLLPEGAGSYRFEPRSTMADDSGRFRVESVAPGDYRVLAWEPSDRNVWLNADALRLRGDQGKAVSVPEAATVTVEVPFPTKR